MELAIGVSAILIRKRVVPCGCINACRRWCSTTIFRPAEQAEALLEICQGFKHAKYQADQLYWSRVEVLLLQHEPAVVMKRLADSRLRR